MRALLEMTWIKCNQLTCGDFWRKTSIHFLCWGSNLTSFAYTFINFFIGMMKIRKNYSEWDWIGCIIKSGTLHLIMRLIRWTCMQEIHSALCHSCEWIEWVKKSGYDLNNTHQGWRHWVGVQGVQLHTQYFTTLLCEIIVVPK